MVYRKGKTPDFSQYDKYYTLTSVFQDIVQYSDIVTTLFHQVEEFERGFEVR